MLDVFDENGNTITESAIGNRILFQGREYDWDTGFYYFRARWYDPDTGRWLSKDPIGISGGLNQYVFCGNNPVMFVSEKIRCSDTSILVIHEEPFFSAESDFLKIYIKVLYNFAEDEFERSSFKVVVPYSQKRLIDKTLRERKQPEKYKQIFDDITK